MLLILSSSLVNATKADTILWKVQSNKAVGSESYKIEQEFSANVARLTNNKLIIKVLPPGGYTSIRASFTAARTRKIDGIFMSPQYWSAADPVFAILGNLVAAWDSIDEYNDWLVNDNGIEYLRKAYGKFGLTLIDYTMRPIESLVSSHPLRSVDDLIGKRIRTPQGMVTDYFNSLGAFSRQIGFDKGLTAFKNNQISILDYGDIVLNEHAGLYEIAKHTNYPGFHSIQFRDFVVNKESWSSLTQAHKNAVQQAMLVWKNDIDNTHKEQIEKTLNQLKIKGVNVYSWSDEEKKRARQSAIPIWLSYAKKSKKAAEIIDELMIKLKEIGNI